MTQERKSRQPGKLTAPSTTAANTTVPPRRRLCWVTVPQDVASQLRRRREASQRLVRLTDCCGARDPISCRCHDPKPQLNEKAVDAWRAAIERTLPIGPPLVPLEVLQRLWRNGGTDRELAERVWFETAGAIA